MADLAGDAQSTLDAVARILARVRSGEVLPDEAVEAIHCLVDFEFARQCLAMLPPGTDLDAAIRGLDKSDDPSES